MLLFAGIIILFLSIILSATVWFTPEWFDIPFLVAVESHLGVIAGFCFFLISMDITRDPIKSVIIGGVIALILTFGAGL